MILRLAANAAVHTAGGVLFGVTAALAACTVAQTAKRMGESMARPSADRPSTAPAAPPEPTDPSPPGSPTV